MLACAECIKSKGDHTLDDWMKSFLEGSEKRKSIEMFRRRFAANAANDADSPCKTYRLWQITRPYLQ